MKLTEGYKPVLPQKKTKKTNHQKSKNARQVPGTNFYFSVSKYQRERNSTSFQRGRSRLHIKDQESVVSDFSKSSLKARRHF